MNCHSPPHDTVDDDQCAACRHLRAHRPRHHKYIVTWIAERRRKGEIVMIYNYTDDPWYYNATDTVTFSNVDEFYTYWQPIRTESDTNAIVVTESMPRSNDKLLHYYGPCLVMCVRRWVDHDPDYHEVFEYDDNHSIVGLLLADQVDLEAIRQWATPTLSDSTKTPCC